MSLKELQNVVMGEDDLGGYVVHVCSLIHQQNRDKVCHSNDGHLVLINLTVLDSNKLVAYVLLAEEFAVCIQDMCDHLVVMGFKKSQKILSG